MTEPREFTLLPLYEIFFDFFCASILLAPDAVAMAFCVGERDARRFGGLSSKADAGAADALEGGDMD